MRFRSSAITAYQGYEYQLLVSVWIALDLILDRELCEAVELEPASQEDIAADLAVPADAAGASVRAGPITIQIKRKADAWTEDAFFKLLKTPEKRGKRGPNPRDRAGAQLASDPTSRYLLVTDGSLHAALEPFAVEQVGDPSRATAANGPPALARDDIASRIAILPRRVGELVARKISEILEEVGHIPFQRVDACRAELVEMARACLLDRRTSRVERVELETVVARHGGAPRSERETFVPPSNFAELERLLDRPPHALILTGPPGIGKTFLAERILENHRRAPRPFEILRPSHPGEIRAALSKAGRFVFYLEDPWGSYKLSADAFRWSDELPRLLRDARNEDKRFVVTSRTGLLLEAMPTAGSAAQLDPTLQRVQVTLHEQLFDRRARLMILRQRMARAPRPVRDWVEDRVSGIINTLRLPHSLVAFAQFAIDTPFDELNIDRLLRDSTSDAIGKRVAQRVSELNGLDAAAILWAFLSANEPLGIEFAARLTAQLRANGVRVDLPLVLKRLSDDGWITWRDDVVITHPSVIEALERLLGSVPGALATVTTDLFRALATDDVPVAVRLATRLHGRLLAIPASVRRTIEDYLRTQALECDEDASTAAIEAFGQLSTSDDPVSLIARALIARQRRPGMFDGFAWEPPAWTAEQHVRVADSRPAQELTRRYIRSALDVWALDSDARRFVAFLGSLGWDLANEFVVACREALLSGSDHITLLVHGALAAARPAYDELIDAALAAVDALDRWWTDDVEKVIRATSQEETDASYSVYVREMAPDKYHAPQSVLALVVKARREREGFDWLLCHPRRNVLLAAWAEAIPDHCGEPSRDEILSLLHACGPKHLSEVFVAIGRSDCRSVIPLLLDRLEHGSPHHLADVWAALFGMLDPPALAALLVPWIRTLPWSRRASALFALREVRIPVYADLLHRDPKHHVRSVQQCVEATEVAAIDACILSERESEDDSEIDDCDDAALDHLAQLAGDDELLTALASVVLAAHARPIAAPHLLSSADATTRRFALLAYLRTSAPARSTLQAMLGDPSYTIRKMALEALAKDASDPERAAIIAMASDPSAPVREACVCAIGEHRWTDGMPTLLARISDDRDCNEASGRAGEAPDHHVARAAARSLHTLARPFPAHVLDTLIDFVQAGSRANRDIFVHRELIRVLAIESDPRLPPLFRRLVTSHWRSHGEFILRTAATSAWVEYALRNPDEIPHAPLDLLVDAAGHSSDRTAAPAILALGIASALAETEIRKFLTANETTPNRALLLDIGARLAGTILKGDLLSPVIPTSHPGRRLLHWWWDAALTSEDVTAHISTDRAIQTWLDQLTQSPPIHGVLRLALRRRRDDALVDHLFPQPSSP